MIIDTAIPINTRFNLYYFHLYCLRRKDNLIQYTKWYHKHSSLFADFHYTKVFEANCLRFEYGHDAESLLRAISLFKEVLQSLPDHIGIKRNLASALLTYCEITGNDDEKIDEALKLTEEAIQYNGTHAKYYSTMAKIKLFKEDFVFCFKKYR